MLVQDRWRAERDRRSPDEEIYLDCLGRRKARAQETETNSILIPANSMTSWFLSW